MSDVSAITPASSYDDLTHLAPEPQNGLSDVFGSVLKTATSVLGGAVSSTVGIDPQYASLLSEQMKQQEQMQLVSLYSNVEKSKHETQMSAIRNVRVG